MNTVQTLIIADFVNTMYGSWECVDPQIDEHLEGRVVGVYLNETEGYISLSDCLLTVSIEGQKFHFGCWHDSCIVPILWRVLPDLFGR